MSTLEEYMQNKRSGRYKTVVDQNNDYVVVRERQITPSSGVITVEKKEKVIDTSKIDKTLLLSFAIVGLLAYVIYLLMTDRVPKEVKDVGTKIEETFEAATLDLKAEFLKWAYDPRTGFGLDCVNIKPVNNHQFLGYGCRITEGNRYENGKIYLGREVRPEGPKQIVN